MPIETIGIVTSNRPAALSRCVTSHAANARRYGRSPMFVVCDDAVASAAQSATRQALHEAARSSDVSIRLVGLAEKIALLAGLRSGRDFPPEVLKFACFDAERCGRGAYGANRNMLLLQTAGTSVLSADDDTAGETHRPVGYHDRLSVRLHDAHDDPSEVWALGARDADAEYAVGAPVDCLGEHERWLGHAIDDGRAIERERGASDASGVMHARVALTSSSVLGDCGWGSPANYLFMSGACLDRLTASDAAYEAYTTSRRILRAVPNPTLCRPTHDFMSTSFALDGAGTPPPFLPVGRGADRLFGLMMARCSPSARFVYLPVVVAHEPSTPRAFWRGEITRSAAGIDLTTLVMLLVSAMPEPAGATAGERLASDGEGLMRLASTPESEFAALATTVVQQALARQIDRLQRTLATPGHRCAAFTRDVRAYVAALQATCARADAWLPLDIRLGRPETEVGPLVRRITGRFGQLLQYWPHLLDASRDLRTQDGPVEMSPR